MARTALYISSRKNLIYDFFQIEQIQKINIIIIFIYIYIWENIFI